MEIYSTDDRPRKPEHQDDGALDEKAAAELLGCGPRKLSDLRKAGKAPPFYRMGNRVRYQKHLLLEWRNEQAVNAVAVWPRRSPTAQAEGGES